MRCNRENSGAQVQSVAADHPYRPLVISNQKGETRSVQCNLWVNYWLVLLGSALQVSEEHPTKNLTERAVSIWRAVT